MHKAGFVNIIGNPNVGKSTLMNALVGERLSIITSKAQTTRHRIMGIVNGEDFQIVYSDTPGILKPHYRLQESMMKFVTGALRDADIILYVTDTVERCDEASGEIVEKIGHSGKSRKNTRSPCAAIGTTSGSLLQNQPTTAGAKIITGMYRKSVMISLIRKAPLSVCATRRNCSAP